MAKKVLLFVALLQFQYPRLCSSSSVDDDELSHSTTGSCMLQAQVGSQSASAARTALPIAPEAAAAALATSHSKTAAVSTVLKPETHSQQRIRNAEADLVGDKYKWWLKLPEVKQIPGAKLAVLIMTKDRITNSAAWVAWLRRANADGVDLAVHIHAYGFAPNTTEAGRKTSDRKAWPAELLAGLELERVASRWCNLWPVQHFLMQKAMADPEVTHMMVIEDNTIPVKSAREIIRQLKEDSSSRFCVDPTVPTGTPRGKASTVFLIRRADAELFDQQQAKLKKTFLQHMRCTDEDAWYWPLFLRDIERQEGGARSTLKDFCTLFDDWNTGVPLSRRQYWSHLLDLCPNCQALRKAPRRFVSDGNHPASFSHLPKEAYLELWNSGFWFARKMDENALDAETAKLAGK
eukprot:TRINITY_DN95425_c0_g1_i1.p1 TRINITY_DN95425_c0_g1~~TRINITY_DN95425_c0_g1_i1.p1  ORF type:complete len:406 (-),score=99.35 TRINITY_DN95425_c0_g1_i1:248-1465(-)